MQTQARQGMANAMQAMMDCRVRALAPPGMTSPAVRLLFRFLTQPQSVLSLRAGRLNQHCVQRRHVSLTSKAALAC